MENLVLTQAAESLHIEGFPDAVCVISIDGDRAVRLSGLALHRSDLQFADEVLKTLNLMAENPLAQQALWVSALVHYFKCFGTGARARLSGEEIYKSSPPEALQAYNYLKALRDKHFVHDINSYTQCLPGAIISGGEKPYKVEKVVCFSARAESLEAGNFSNLVLLIQEALAWVTAEADKLCDEITKELEALTREELLSRPRLTYSVPTPKDAIKRR